MTHKTLLRILEELMVLNVAFLAKFFINRVVYLIILENQIQYCSL